MPKVFRNPELERRIQERLWGRTAKRHETRIRRILSAQYVAAASAVASGRKPPKIEPGRLVDAVGALMRESYSEIGKRAAVAVKDTQGRAGKRAVPMDPALEAGMGRYIRKNAARKVKAVNDVTKARIAIEVQRGIDDGLDNRTVAENIREKGLIDSAYRSQVIARTEGHAAANAGSLESALESGVVLEKEWIFTEDERTRDGENGEFDHTGVANVKPEEPFIVSGEELMFPGDPAGSAGNVINCRCAIGYVV
jgi:hypothetical protein